MEADSEGGGVRDGDGTDKEDVVLENKEVMQKQHVCTGKAVTCQVTEKREVRPS